MAKEGQIKITDLCDYSGHYSDDTFCKIATLPQAIPKSCYYVYAIIDCTKKSVLYVGKGKGNRILSHFRNSRQPTTLHIRELISSGHDIGYRIIASGSDEEEILRIEAEMIITLREQFNLLNTIHTSNKSTGIGQDLYLVDRAYKLLFQTILLPKRDETDPRFITKAEKIKILLDMMKQTIAKHFRLQNKYFVCGSAIENITAISLKE